ncbi:MAG: M28 family peptidase, partial [Vicinamibacterales bacterium]|nr:M28 family peptidase [Vicinamibacterales bacterium]
EEQGLLGAWAYTQAPLHPLTQTIAVLNMDMIGRNEEIPPAGGARFRGLAPQTAESNRNAVNILGYSRSPDLRRVADRANGLTDLELKFRYDDNSSNLLRRSDQWPFLYRGVPALFVHTGLHPDYHTERDRPDKINYGKMARIVRMVHQMSWNLAQNRERPTYSAP